MENKKRLIEANAIEAKIEKNFRRLVANQSRSDLAAALSYVGDLIIEAPTVDAVEVPCKIGQTVYVINGLWVSNYVVTHFWYDGRFFKFKAINEEYAYECRDFSFFDERIGKTVFFTYEQAESALKKMYGGNDDGKSL